MWQVKVEQKQFMKYSQKEITVEVNGSFESIEEARNFATLLLKGFPKTTATITHFESNFEEEGQEETKE